MRRYLSLFIILLLVTGLSVGGYLFYVSRTRTTQTAANPCAGAQTGGGQTVESCVTVSGTVLKVTQYLDGSLDIQLKPSAGTAYLVNEHNLLAQNDGLLVHVDCADHSITPERGVICTQYQPATFRPWVSDQVSFTGLVERSPVFGWNQLQPVSSAQE